MPEGSYGPGLCRCRGDGG